MPLLLFFILNVLDHSMKHPLFQDPRSLALPIQDQEQAPHHPLGAQPLLPDQHQRMAGLVSSINYSLKLLFLF